MDIVTLFVGVTLSLVLAVLIYWLKRKSRKKRQKETIKDSGWSIGYQLSTQPFDINPQTAKVYGKPDMPAGSAGIADPFLFEHNDTIYLFYELIVNTSPNAKLAVSTYNAEKQGWDFHSVILDEPFHLSYPYVFKKGSDIYMIPETKKAGAVRLYRAVDFPSEWQFERNLLDDKKFVDSSILFKDGCFFLFTSRKRKLYLYTSATLEGDWKLHPKSPIKRWNYARCAGRLFEHGGKLYRFAQEQAKGYGMGLRRYEILELSTSNYKEVAMDDGLFLEPCGDSWAQHGMHHLDILQLAENRYLSVFDGRGTVKDKGDDRSAS
jgi:hypothetical protein